jgi:hypothetical protein
MRSKTQAEGWVDMSNMDRYSNKPKIRNDQKQAHPIWRGVGFGLMVILPIISYATALILIGMNNSEHWIMIPRDLLVRNRDPLLLIKVVLTLILMAGFAIILTLIFQILYGIFGPSRYGPTDVPNVAGRFKKYKR